MSGVGEAFRDAMRIARVNRMKQRHGAWWHAEHCSSCKEGRGGPPPELAQRIMERIFGGSVEVEASIGHDFDDPPKKAH